MVGKLIFRPQPTYSANFIKIGVGHRTRVLRSLIFVLLSEDSCTEYFAVTLGTQETKESLAARLAFLFMVIKTVPKGQAICAILKGSHIMRVDNTNALYNYNLDILRMQRYPT